MVARTDTELVDILVPVHNEARTLEVTIARLRDYLDRSFPFPAVVTIADNDGNDGNDALDRSVASRLDGVRALHLDEKGPGRALRASWIASRAKVVAYMDADLATGLEALLPLVAPLLSGHSDVAIGTRLTGDAHVVRGLRRELISRCYNALFHVALALALCTTANPWAHARLARPGAARPSGRQTLVAGTVLFAVILALTSAGLALASLVDPSSKLLEVVAIAVATASAALLRFVVVHAWFFRHHRRLLGTQIPTGEETAA